MTYHPQNFVVWTEIPATDLDRAIAFYSAVFETEIAKDQMGPKDIAMYRTAGQAGVAGHLYVRPTV